MKFKFHFYVPVLQRNHATYNKRIALTQQRKLSKVKWCIHVVGVRLAEVFQLIDLMNISVFFSLVHGRLVDHKNIFHHRHGRFSETDAGEKAAFPTQNHT